MNIFAMKASALLFWVLAITAWVQNWEGLLSYLPMIGLVVAGVHAMEVVLFLVSFRNKSTNVRLDAAQILLFGMFHLQRFMPRR